MILYKLQEQRMKEDLIYSTTIRTVGEKNNVGNLDMYKEIKNVLNAIFTFKK